MLSAFLYIGEDMANYYDEVLANIHALIKEGNYQKAMDLVRNELSMPYIPSDTEKELKQLKKDLMFQMSDKSGGTEQSLDRLLEMLQGKPEQQLAATASLSKRNLRDCIPEIQQYLLSDPFEEAGALIVEAIAEQQIGEEFVWMRKGVEYTFFGDGLTPVAESKGFLEAGKLLNEWLSNDHPDMYEMAKTLIVHDVYMFLPLSYEEEEGESLAFDVLEQVSNMMDDGDTYQLILDKLSEKRKMN